MVEPSGVTRQHRRVVPIENVLHPIEVMRRDDHVRNTLVRGLNSIARDRPLLASPENKAPAAIALVCALVDHGCHYVANANKVANPDLEGSGKLAASMSALADRAGGALLHPDEIVFQSEAHTLQ